MYNIQIFILYTFSSSPYGRRIKRKHRHCNINENSEKAKSERLPKAVQRASPLALAFPFCDPLELCRRALVWRSEATPLVIDKRTPWCQIKFYIHHQTGLLSFAKQQNFYRVLQFYFFLLHLHIMRHKLWPLEQVLTA